MSSKCAQNVIKMCFLSATLMNILLFEMKVSVEEEGR
jgi:hypothetical protein